MDKEKHPLSEEEIRALVQREIAERERVRTLEKQIQDDRDRTKEEIVRYREIIDEEKRKYYESHPEYREYINEAGELEWLTNEEIHQREQLFDSEIEELDSGKKQAKWVLFLVFGLLFCAIVLVIALLSEKTGTIQVISNVKGAHIILDSSQEEQVTDAIFMDVPVGKHVISIELPGYRIEGDLSQEINLSSKEREIVVFTLTKDISSQTGTEDKIKTVFK